MNIKENEQKIIQLQKEIEQEDVIYVVEYKSDKSDTRIAYKALQQAYLKHKEYESLDPKILCYKLSHEVSLCP